MAGDGESLESCLNKATDPSNRQEDWEHIMAFCDQVNKDLEGPQISVRLLVHKIQSPQEWEALQALTVLETCMENCGRRFHNEVGKFKFLNELVKVISPKYLGDRVSEKVKAKVIAMLYSWTVSLPDEAKISEAYQMLKTQGVLSADPEIPLDATSVPSPRQKNPVFDDEKKNKRLAELLKSKKPEDLQEANRLIKNMVKEDDVRSKKATKQKSTLEAVGNSVKLLDEMLAHYSPETSTDGDKELIKELYRECDKLRQTVCQFATESEDNDSSLGDILQASDDLTHVINSYKKIEEGLAVSEEAESAHQTQPDGTGCTNQTEILIDLVGPDVQSNSVPQQQQLQTSSVSVPADLLWGSADHPSSSHNPPSAAFSLLDEELLSLGLNESVPVKNTPAPDNPSSGLPFSQELGQDLAHFDITPSVAPADSTSSFFPDVLSATTVNFPKSSSTTSSALNFLGPVFTTPSVFTELVPTAPVTFPQPPSSALPCTLPAVLPQSSSLTPPVNSAVTFGPPPSGVSQPRSSLTSLTHCLQNLDLLDLKSHSECCPNARITLSAGNSLPVKTKDPLSPVASSSSHGSNFNKSTSLILGEMQGGSFSPSTKSQADDTPKLHSLYPVLPHAMGHDGSLADVFVPLDAIKPSQVCPVTAYDKNGVRVLLHFAANSPAGRSDVLVMVASMLSTAPLPVRNIMLQAAVPKMMKVRLQQPTGTELASFNPVLPPASITQVVLLANPLKEKVRMRFKLSFILGEKIYTEVGEVNEFPPADTWGAL